MSEKIRTAMQFAIRSIIGPTNETEAAWLEGRIDRAYAKYMAKDVLAQPPMNILELADEIQSQPRVADNDNGEITVTFNGKELRGFIYSDDTTRRLKMLAAREYIEGWCDGRDAR